MTTKPLLLLVALTLFCCFTSLHGQPRGRCYCIRTTSNRVPPHIIKKIEVHPVSGYCRRTEIIITRKNNSKICIDPQVKWMNNMLDILQKREDVLVNSTDQAVN